MFATELCSLVCFGESVKAEGFHGFSEVARSNGRESPFPATLEALADREIPMLVLTRKVGEKVQIGQDVWVVVKKISGSRVALGFEALPDLPIRRGEIVARDSDATDNS